MSESVITIDCLFTMTFLQHRTSFVVFGFSCDSTGPLRLMTEFCCLFRGDPFGGVRPDGCWFHKTDYHLPLTLSVLVPTADGHNRASSERDDLVCD